MYIVSLKYNSFYSNLIVIMCMIPCIFVIQFRFCHLPKKEEIVELHSMLLTISPFMFWDDPKTLSESILFLLVFWLETEFQDCYLQCLRTLANNVLKP